MNDETSQTTHESEHGDGIDEQAEGAIPQLQEPLLKSSSQVDGQNEQNDFDNSMFDGLTQATNRTPNRQASNLAEEGEFSNLNIFGQAYNHSFLEMLSSNKCQMKDALGSGNWTLRSMLDQIRDITDQKVLNRLGSKISSGSLSDGASM